MWKADSTTLQTKFPNCIIVKMLQRKSQEKWWPRVESRRTEVSEYNDTWERTR